MKQAQPRIEMVYPGIMLLAQRGTLFAPRDISWRRAHRIAAAGLATVYLFHERWKGKVEITEAGRLLVRKRSE